MEFSRIENYKDRDYTQREVAKIFKKKLLLNFCYNW